MNISDENLISFLILKTNQISIFLKASTFRSSTDSGCWKALIQFGDNQIKFSKEEHHVSQPVLELVSAIKILDGLPCHCKIDLYSQSDYLINGITKWIKQWKLNGFKSSLGKEIKHSHLWKRFDQACKRHQITWNLVKVDKRFDILQDDSSSSILNSNQTGTKYASVKKLPDHLQEPKPKKKGFNSARTRGFRGSTYGPASSGKVLSNDQKEQAIQSLKERGLI